MYKWRGLAGVCSAGWRLINGCLSKRGENSNLMCIGMLLFSIINVGVLAGWRRRIIIQYCRL